MGHLGVPVSSYGSPWVTWGSLWVSWEKLGVPVGHCGSLWVLVGHCGSVHPPQAELMSALIECCIALGGTEPPPSPPQRRPRPQRLATIDYVEDGGHWKGGGEALMGGTEGGERPPVTPSVTSSPPSPPQVRSCDG